MKGDVPCSDAKWQQKIASHKYLEGILGLLQYIQEIQSSIELLRIWQEPKHNTFK